MRIGKSKSTLNVNKHSKNNPEVRINKNQLQDLYEKEAELEDLHSKIDRSKPILESIYDKIKKKEKRYEQTINELNLKVGSNKRLLTQYKQLYEEGLKIMQRNKLIDRFKGYSNYREYPIAGIHQNEKEKTYSNLTKQLKQQYGKDMQIDFTANKNIDKIKRIYLSSDKKSISKQQIYNQYRLKIQNDSEIKLQNKTEMSMKQYSQKLLGQIERDLLDLTQKKESSGNRWKRDVDEKEMKMKYLKMQREKLLKI